jgi:hypothetical protein
MSKKISRKITPSFSRNDRRYYAGGAASWTAIAPDETQEDLGPDLPPDGEPQAGALIAETPLRKFLFLKIPVEMSRRQAQDILADAWGRIKTHPGKADWKQYQGVLDRLDADIAAWADRFEDYSYKDVLKSARGHLNQIERLIEGTIEQARKESRQKWGTSTSSDKRKKATARKIKKLVKAEQTKGHKIEMAFGIVGDNLNLSTQTVRRYNYSK